MDTWLYLLLAVVAVAAFTIGFMAGKEFGERLREEQG